jgi:hypothetical protein
MDILSEKSQMMAFSGQDPVRYNITVDNKCLPQVKRFKYFGCEISYGNKKIFNKNYDIIIK